MKILLLGGNGYIGSKLYSIINKKWSVDSVDLCLFGKDLGYSMRLDFGDIPISNYDAVICLAGHSSVPMAESNATLSWQNNVDNFRTLCDRLTKEQLLIYASSASVYGTNSGPSSEYTAINFSTIYNYDLQKITIDLIANRWINTGKKIVGLRFGTVNGPSPNTRADLMLNSMVKSAITTGVVNAKNLKARRAILGIGDLCRAIEAILVIGVQPGQYNLSSFNSSVGVMADQVAQITGARLQTHPDDPVYYDFEMETEKFTSATGFKFTETVESIIGDLKDNFSGVVFDIRDTGRNYGSKS